MIRKFTLTLLVILAFGSLSFGQATASLPTVTASPNENVAMDLNVANFTNIGAITFKIQIDTNVLSFQNYSNAQTTGFIVSRQTGSSLVTIIWTPTSGSFYNFSPGRLLTLNFKYNGLSSSLVFNNECEVANGSFQPIAVTYTNGAISPVLTNTQQAHLGNVSANIGGIINVPLTYTGLAGTSASAITQKISYDPSKLTFLSVTGSGQLAGGINAGAAGGIVTLVWTNAGGALINTALTQFNVNFMYTGSVVTPVNFSTGCIITATGTNANIPVTYNNGSVTPLGPPTSFATVGTRTDAIQGQQIDVPLTFSGMPAGITSFTVNLTYDNPRMSFLYVVNPLYSVTANGNGNTISIVYNNPGAPDINGQFLSLRFMYNGVGTANINFTSGCQFSNGSNVGVGYTNGSVSPAPALVTGTLGNVGATSPAAVAIPVTFTGIPTGTDVGSITLVIGFDLSKLTYINAVNPYSATIQPVGNKINISWTYSSAAIVNGTPFVTLNFNYAASGSASTQVTFLDGCELATNITGAIIPTNWINGGVNNLFKLSGMLTYDIPSSIPLDNSTIYIKDGPEPVPPATTPVPNVLYTATTNASGYFEIYLPNGTYYLYAGSTKLWGGVDGVDILQLRRYLANLSNLITSPIRLRSADITMDGNIDGVDLLALRRRVANLTPNPNFKAPDWIFENPTSIISGSDLPNQNFTGLCAGDYNGSY